MDETRTILIEHPYGQAVPLEKKSYYVIANRHPGQGGCKAVHLHSSVLDSHYLLVVAHTKEIPGTAFAIVDADKTQEAADRLYEKALKCSQERANCDGNRVVDLSSRTGGIVGEDLGFIPDEYSGRGS